MASFICNKLHKQALVLVYIKLSPCAFNKIPWNIEFQDAQSEFFVIVFIWTTNLYKYLLPSGSNIKMLFDELKKTKTLQG